MNKIIEIPTPITENADNAIANIASGFYIFLLREARANYACPRELF